MVLIRGVLILMGIMVATFLIPVWGLLILVYLVGSDV